MLALIRDNLFQPRLTVERIKRALGVGANDLTTRFRDAAGAPIRQYLDDRRLECASRLLEDTVLDVETIAGLVGHRSAEVFSRAFKRRYGVRPPVYREFGGGLSGEAAARAAASAAADAGAGRSTVVPRYLAGMAAASPGGVCARCGGGLEPAPVRVFEDLAPICGGCARERAPELVDLLDAGGSG